MIIKSNRSGSFTLNLFRRSSVCKMIFDTGATCTILTTATLFGGNKASRKLYWNKLLSLSNVTKVELADGSKVDSCSLVLKDVELLGVTFPRLLIKVLDSDEPYGLVGTDVTKYVEYNHKVCGDLVIGDVDIVGYDNTVDNNTITFAMLLKEEPKSNLFDTLKLVNGG